MRQSSFRFSPPPCELPEAARWTVLAAFSNAGLPLARDLDGDDIITWSGALGVTERIASRHGSEELAAALAPTIVEELVACQRRSAARALLLLELARLIAGIAGRLGSAVVLLKGLALLARGVSPAGHRGVYDVDVLVPSAVAHALFDELRSRGLQPGPVDESSQHLRALIHPRLGVTEIHVLLRGVRVSPAREAVFEDLVDADLCRPAPGLDHALTPIPTILAAHALAHGIAQHGRSPDSYPLLRLLADLEDLAPAKEGLAPLVEAARPFLAGSVSQRELEAVVDLTQQLGRGLLPPAGDAAALLCHTAAPRLAPDYVRGLKVEAFWQAVRRRDWKKLWRRINRSWIPAARPIGAAGSGGRRGDLSSTVLGTLGAGWFWIAHRARGLATRWRRRPAADRSDEST